MAGQCKDCRFYDGKTCAVLKSARTSNSSCANWVSSTEHSTVKQCKACRFYDGRICSVNGQRTPNSTCAKWSAFK
jgi:hypothetical protein